MYDAHILTDVGAQNIYAHGSRIGYAVNIRINYYRGLPLSCIDEIALTVDGEPIAPGQMRLQYNGKEYPYARILTENMNWDEYWFFGDLLRVVVLKEDGIPQGRHDVELTLAFRRSYTPTNTSVCKKTLTFA